MRADPLVSFLAGVLRRSWPVAAVPFAMCAEAGGGMWAFLVALSLALGGAATSLHGILHDRRAATIVAAGIDLYALALTFLIVTPRSY